MRDVGDEMIALYQRHAVAWDRERRRSTLVERGWLDRFCSLVRPGGTVLDLGCGGGVPIARYLTDAGYRVTGVDASPNLLRFCQVRWPEGDWRVADMRTLALGEAFDGILAWNSFFHLPRDDQRRMFAVFARHAAPGAPLMFTSGLSDGVGIVVYHGDVMHHASLDPHEYRRLLAANGFAVLDHVAQDPGCGEQTVWLCRRVPPSAPAV
jgi:SAM-dependent methyltransferase